MVIGLKSKSHAGEGLKNLSSYIEEHHGGNNSDFAKAVGVERNQVQQWLRAQKPIFVVDGKLVALVREIGS